MVMMTQATVATLSSSSVVVHYFFCFLFFFLILCICFHTCSLHYGTEEATRYLCTTLTNKVDFLALQILQWTEWPLHSPAVLRTSCCTNSFGAWAPKNPSVKNIVFVQNCVALPHQCSYFSDSCASLNCLLCIHVILMHSNNLISASPNWCFKVIQHRTAAAGPSCVQLAKFASVEFMGTDTFFSLTVPFLAHYQSPLRSYVYTVLTSVQLMEKLLATAIKRMKTLPPNVSKLVRLMAATIQTRLL